MKKRIFGLTAVIAAGALFSCQLPSGLDVKTNDFKLYAALQNVLTSQTGSDGTGINIGDYVDRAEIEQQVKDSISDAANKDGRTLDEVKGTVKVWANKNTNEGVAGEINLGSTKVDVTKTKTFVLYYPAFSFKGLAGFGQMIPSSVVVSGQTIPIPIDWNGMIPASFGTPPFEVPISDLKIKGDVEFDFPGIGEIMRQLRGLKIKTVYMMAYLRTKGFADAGGITLNILKDEKVDEEFFQKTGAQSDWFKWAWEKSPLDGSNNDASYKGGGEEADGDISISGGEPTGAEDFAERLADLKHTYKFKLDLNDLQLQPETKFADLAIALEFAIVLPFEFEVVPAGTKDDDGNLIAPMRKDKNGDYFREIDIQEYEDMKENLETQIKDLKEKLKEKADTANADIATAIIYLSDFQVENFINGLRICVSGSDENDAWTAIEFDPKAKKQSFKATQLGEQLPMVSLGLPCNPNGEVTESLKLAPTTGEAKIDFTAEVSITIKAGYGRDF